MLHLDENNLQLKWFNYEVRVEGGTELCYSYSIDTWITNTII